MEMPLRYEISDWHQLPGVKSNNSQDLCIKVMDFVQDNRLQGTKIQVIHQDFGTLFAYVVNPAGEIISGHSGNPEYELTTGQLLKQLENFGFLVTFAPQKHLPAHQLEFLKSLQELHFDKLRVLSVWHLQHGIKVFRWYVVVFHVEQNPDWINSGYAPSEKEYETALKNGSALNVSALSQKYRWDWSWLDFVANISDILEENQ